MPLHLPHSRQIEIADDRECEFPAVEQNQLVVLQAMIERLSVPDIAAPDKISGTGRRTPEKTIDFTRKIRRYNFVRINEKNPVMLQGKMIEAPLALLGIKMERN